MSNQRNEQLSQLYRAVLSLRSEEECRAFLRQRGEKLFPLRREEG